MNAGGVIFGSLEIHESLKNQLKEKEAKITKFNQKLLNNRKSQHLGCESEIQSLKSQLIALQQNPIPQEVLLTLNDTELRVEQLEKEVQQVKKQLVDVQFELTYMKYVLEKKEKEINDKRRNNVDMLKKYIDDKATLKTSLQNYEYKVKEI